MWYSRNQGAAEVRRNVSTVFVSQTSNRSSTASSFIHLASGTVMTLTIQSTQVVYC